MHQRRTTVIGRTREDAFVGPSREAAEAFGVSDDAWGAGAYGLLLEAHQYGRQLGRSLWDFAVEISTLQQAGLTVSTLRWLVCKGFVEHGRETTMYDDPARSFRRSTGLRFGKTTCFVLTETGREFVLQKLAGAGWCDGDRMRAGQAAHNGPLAPVEKPQWDAQRQELRVGSVVVKQFKVRALNQEMVLAAFEEEGWPPRIDDPLPPHPELDAKRRLHDTITSLNRNQRRRSLRFLGDGSGQGIRWELTLHGQEDGNGHASNGNGASWA
jgi:hypothetical protein